MMVVDQLRWEELAAAAAQPLALDELRAALQPVVDEAWDGPRRRRPHERLAQIADQLDAAVLATLGAWAAGWNWATSEPGGGGPIATWCCPGHSVFRQGDADSLATVTRVVASVVQWQEFVQQLDAQFEVLRARLDGLAVDVATERAAAELLPLIVERTHCEDAWYATFALALAWYLESTGLFPEEARAIILPLISGRFESWMEPTPEQAADTCAALGRALADTLAAASRSAETSVDALEAWLRVRATCLAAVPLAAADQRVAHDSHARYIERWDAPRGEQRADAMRSALARCRSDAATQVPLTFETLRAWQALVLSDPSVGFRTGPAAAKGGRERYGFGAATQARFEACLAESEDATLPLAARATRLYLDVCFFHPFADGNGRAARLALDYCLAREGCALHAVEPVFVVSRGATDARGAWCLAYVVGRLLGAVPAREPGAEP